MKMLRFPYPGGSALLLGSVFYFLLSPSAFPQGSLTPPPGTPAPAMKTLDQIDTHIDVKGEKRIDLQNAPASAVTTTDANYHFIINQPGSYYLSANVGVTKPNGIQINAEGVTLDLNGFQISRIIGTGGSGILIGGASHRASVRNGSITGFSNGVLCNGVTASACSFRDLSVSNCTSAGISAGPGAVVESCRAYNNSGSKAISADVGSSLTNCTATSNSVQYGIFANTGSSLTNCSAYSNTSGALASGGISTGNVCTLSQCTAYSNTSTAGTPTFSTGAGFSVGNASTIRDCTAGLNKGDGFLITFDTLARGNSSVDNGFGGDGGGIHATGGNNRIESNNVTGNDRGIDVSAAGNLIIKNSASDNNLNYSIAIGNSFGAIVIAGTNGAAISGNSAASTLTSTDPWANISY